MADKKTGKVKPSAGNAVQTTGKEGVRKKESAYAYKSKKSSHPLMKAAIWGYAIGNTINGIKAEKLKKRIRSLERETRMNGMAGQGTFSSYVAMYTQDDLARKLEKRERKQARAMKVGRVIGSVLNMARESGRTLAMRSAVSSSYGAASGINRDDVTHTAAAVALTSYDDGQIEF